jgi:hypothetical protein
MLRYFGDLFVRFQCKRRVPLFRSLRQESDLTIFYSHIEPLRELAPQFLPLRINVIE